MNPRLLILLAVAAVLAVFLAQKLSGQPKPTTDDGTIDKWVPTGPDGGDWDPETQIILTDRDLPGEEPPEDAEFNVQVEVNETSGKTRLDIYMDEVHGYYAESFKLEIWYKDSPDMDSDESALLLTHYENHYVKANETHAFCFEVVPAELASVGGEMGKSENWEAEVVWYHRARVENPDPLPLLSNTRRCD